jgi:hypothetical protein
MLFVAMLATVTVLFMVKRIVAAACRDFLLVAPVTGVATIARKEATRVPMPLGLGNVPG